jgi:hypothetical protein
LGLEWGPISLVSTIEELLGRKSSGSGLENRDTAVGNLGADYTTPLFYRFIDFIEYDAV